MLILIRKNYKLCECSWQDNYHESTLVKRLFSDILYVKLQSTLKTECLPTHPHANLLFANGQKNQLPKMELIFVTSKQPNQGNIIHAYLAQLKFTSYQSSSYPKTNEPVFNGTTSTILSILHPLVSSR